MQKTEIQNTKITLRWNRVGQDPGLRQDDKRFNLFRTVKIASRLVALAMTFLVIFGVGMVRNLTQVAAQQYCTCAACTCCGADDGQGPNGENCSGRTAGFCNFCDEYGNNCNVLPCNDEIDYQFTNCGFPFTSGQCCSDGCVGGGGGGGGNPTPPPGTPPPTYSVSGTV